MVKYKLKKREIEQIAEIIGVDVINGECIDSFYTRVIKALASAKQHRSAKNSLATMKVRT